MIIVVVRSSFACTAEEEVDKMVRGNTLPKARPGRCLTFPGVRGTCHVIIAVVRSFFLASDTGSDGERQKPQSHMAE